MARETISSPQPPKFTGSVKEDSQNIFKWAHDWFRVRVMMQRTTARVDAAAAITELSQTISSPPTQSEVTALQSKINEIIVSLR